MKTLTQQFKILLDRYTNKLADGTVEFPIRIGDTEGTTFFLESILEAVKERDTYVIGELDDEEEDGPWAYKRVRNNLRAQQSQRQEATL